MSYSTLLIHWANIITVIKSSLDNVYEICSLNRVWTNVIHVLSHIQVQS